LEGQKKKIHVEQWWMKHGIKGPPISKHARLSSYTFCSPTSPYSVIRTSNSENISWMQNYDMLHSYPYLHKSLRLFFKRWISSHLNQSWPGSLAVLVLGSGNNSGMFTSRTRYHPKNQHMAMHMGSMAPNYPQKGMGFWMF
jgi:hypothetical protein